MAKHRKLEYNPFKLDRSVTIEDDDDYEFLLLSYWYAALEAVDQRQDKRPLCDVLRQIEAAEFEHYYSDEFTPLARHHLADMLGRYDLKLFPYGRPKPPRDSSPWQQAFEAIYRNDEKKPQQHLMDLLKSPAEISSADREDFAYLLEQHDLKRPARRPTTPSYELSEIEKRLIVARYDVRSRVEGGQIVEQAVTDAASRWNLSYNQLYYSYTGQRGGTRRAMKRLKK